MKRTSTPFEARKKNNKFTEFWQSVIYQFISNYFYTTELITEYFVRGFSLKKEESINQIISFPQHLVTRIRVIHTMERILSSWRNCSLRILSFYKKALIFLEMKESKNMVFSNFSNHLSIIFQVEDTHIRFESSSL